MTGIMMREEKGVRRDGVVRILSSEMEGTGRSTYTLRLLVQISP